MPTRTPSVRSSPSPLPFDHQPVRTAAEVPRPSGHPHDVYGSMPVARRALVNAPAGLCPTGSNSGSKLRTRRHNRAQLIPPDSRPNEPSGPRILAAGGGAVKGRQEPASSTRRRCADSPSVSSRARTAAQAHASPRRSARGPARGARMSIVAARAHGASGAGAAALPAGRGGAGAGAVGLSRRGRRGQQIAALGARPAGARHRAGGAARSARCP
jgi:hypothetical protein